MAEDHRAPKAGHLPRAWTRGRRETRVAKERAAQRVRNWTVQNEMRDVLGRVTAIQPFIETRNAGTGG